MKLFALAKAFQAGCIEIHKAGKHCYFETTSDRKLR